MRKGYWLVLAMLIAAASAQTGRPAGTPGRLPWCSKVFAPQEVKGEMVYPVSNIYGVSGPVLLRKTQPIVPDDKVNRKGVAIVCGIVSVDGLIRTTFMDRSIGNGLDEVAIDTVKQWRFRPATRFGEAVAAPVSLIIKFGN